MRKRARLVVVVGLAATVGPLTLAFPAQAAFPGKNGRIAFTVQPRIGARRSRRRSRPCCPAGAGGACSAPARRQTASRPSRPGHRTGGAWRSACATQGSRQGSRPSARSGTGLRRLPRLTGPYGAPAWAPSGRRLLFPGEGGLFTARTDGTGVRPGHPDAHGLRFRVVAARRHRLRPRRRPLPSDDAGRRHLHRPPRRLPAPPARPGQLQRLRRPPHRTGRLTAASSRSLSPIASTPRSTWPMRPAERTGG